MSRTFPAAALSAGFAALLVLGCNEQRQDMGEHRSSHAAGTGR
jgi:hypothetical protein